MPVGFVALLHDNTRKAVSCDYSGIFKIFYIFHSLQLGLRVICRSVIHEKIQYRCKQCPNNIIRSCRSRQKPLTPSAPLTTKCIRESPHSRRKNQRLVRKSQFLRAFRVARCSMYEVFGLFLYDVAVYFFYELTLKLCLDRK